VYAHRIIGRERLQHADEPHLLKILRPALAPTTQTAAPPKK
jgi:hypothetical protein